MQTRADGGVTVTWQAGGRFAVPPLRIRGLHRYQRILGELGMVTVLQTNIREPYLACWLPGQRARVTARVRVAPASGGPLPPVHRAAS